MKLIEIKLDKLWRDRVISIYGKRCNICLRAHNIDAHHIYGRGKSVRWRLDNGICLCRECHQNAHKNVKMFRKLYGTETLEKLSRQFAKDIDYKEIENKLKGEQAWN